MNLMRRSVINLFTNSRGGLTMEFIIVIPILLTFMLAFIQVFYIFNLQIQLQSLNSEIVRELSTNWPVTKLVLDQSPSKLKLILNNKYGKLFIRNSISINPVIKVYADRPLKTKNIQAKVIDFPSSSSNILSVQLSYKYKIVIPFFSKNIQLHSRAKEQVWGN